MRIGFITYNSAFIPMWVEKLYPYLDGMDIVVFHISKLLKTPPKIIDGVEYCDLSWKSGKTIKNIIAESKVDACIILNFRSLFEQVILRICNELNIKSIYLEHGLVSMNTTKFKKNKIKGAFFSTINRQLNFLYKYGTYIMTSKQKLLELQILKSVYLEGKFYMSQFDYYLLFSERSYGIIKYIFNFNKETKVNYVGYPIFADNMQKNMAKIDMSFSNGVLYVHQPFINDGFSPISYDEEKKYIVDLANSLKEKESKFTILLHPRENLFEYKKRFEGTGIEIVQSPNNFLCFADKSLIVGHYSTAMLFALYFNKPTVIVEYPKTKLDNIYSDCFDYVSSINDLRTHTFLGPLTTKEYFVGPNNTYESIAHSILNIINDK